MLTELERVMFDLQYMEDVAYGWNLNGMVFGKPVAEIENTCANAIKLLRKLRPRVMTAEEVRDNGDVVFAESRSGRLLDYAIVDHAYTNRRFCLLVVSADNHWNLTWDDYGKNWRCWTTEPSDEEMQFELWLQKGGAENAESRNS